MGRIPEVTRQKLASSVTGTPGVDPSGAIIAGAVGDVGRAFARREAQERQQKQRQQLKTQDALNTVNASNGAARFSSELNRIGRDARNQEEYDQLSQEAFDRAVDGFDDDEAKARFSTRAATLRIRKGDDFFKNNEKRKMGQIETGINNTVEELAADTDEIFGAPEIPFDVQMDIFTGNLDTAIDTVNSVKGILGAEAHKEFADDAAQALTRAAVLSMMDTNPENVEAFLDTVNAIGILDKEEVTEIRKQATEYAKVKEKQRAIVRLKGNYDVGQTWANLPTGEYPSEAEINRAILNEDVTTAKANAMRKLKASSTRSFIGDNPEGLVRLTKFIADITDLEEAKKAAGSTLGFGGETKAVQDDLEARFYAAAATAQQKVLEAMEAGPSKGGISESTGVRLMKSLGSAFTDDVEKIQKRVSDEIKSLKFTSDFVFEMKFTDPAQTVEARGLIEASFLERIDRRNAEKGRDLTFKEMMEVRDEVIDSFTSEVNPAKTAFELGTVHNINGQNLQVAGHRPNGNPFFTANIKAVNIPPKDNK